MSYSAEKRVKEYLDKYKEYRELAKTILQAYNAADPIGAYFGDNCNPDEYLGYATRFMEVYLTLSDEEKQLELSNTVEKAWLPNQRLLNHYTDWQEVSDENHENTVQILTNYLQDFYEKQNCH